MSAVDGALGKRTEDEIVADSRRRRARVAVVDPRGLRCALKACGFGGLAGSGRIARAATVHRFNQRRFVLGLAERRGLAKFQGNEGAADFHQVVIVIVPMVGEDSLGDGLSYKRVERGHALIVSRRAGSATAWRAMLSGFSNAARDPAIHAPSMWCPFGNTA